MFRKEIFVFYLVLFSISIGFSQTKYTISGYIADVQSGEMLIAANVFESETGAGTVTNTFGFFSITLPKSTENISISYIGYQTKTIEVNLQKDTHLDIALSSDVLLQEVEVLGDRVEKIEEQTQMSRVDVPVEQIKKVPTLFGEVDVLKTLQLLPGVQSGGEGQTGLYVRGGSPDQNLILLDGVPVYNVSHLLGIFSVFNADAIKTVTLTKGGFPARFGGRLSSVLEINMKDGHKNEIHGEGSIGLISSKFTLQGPIIKEKTTFLISARRTYWDLLAKPLLRKVAKEESGGDTKVNGALFFYDMNAKITHKINNKNRLYLSFYAGADVFKLDTEESSNGQVEDKINAGIDWGNTITALRWNHQFTPKLFSNSTFTFSNYDLNIGIGGEEHYDDDVFKFSARYLSGIRDFSGKLDFDYIPTPNHYIRFGASATNHQYSPGAIVLKASEEDFAIDTTIGDANIYSMEYDTYIEDDIIIGALKMNIGVHMSAFTPKDTAYFSIQPRLGLRYLLPNKIALKASFTTMNQYINLLTSESLSLPSDLWVPSTKNVLPQSSWQTGIGIAKSFDDFELSIEGFYKKMNNVVSYLPGESFLGGFETLDGDGSWENKVTQGIGTSYGAEIFLQKKKGKTTGWIGYTLAWNWRQFDEVNNGVKFPYRYDRRHDISIVVSHQFTDKISVAATWVYGTGNAISLPLYKYPKPGATLHSLNQYFGNYNEVEAGGEKNNFRMSDYHRLDVGIDFTKKKKRWTRTWSFGVYNAYANHNPYFVLRDNDINPVTGEDEIVFKEYSILPFIPSVSYSFKF